ncbi:hypothetical protein [Novosphingobium cyanobacteriorum]|uniref:Uncharacterized protein n=1 Tax=Novosphingobium cyanobacteriorum TaxID=3024215 RepID=A0ABT6CME3_9SPHN|nr:hypothetical protein [Novosphingobium cyanobacteriorum]MDF8335084.1 hypothetical protein [Novosphingobium cyanobacteriorum]
MQTGNRSVIVLACLAALAGWSFFAGWYFCHLPRAQRYEAYRYAADKPVKLEPSGKTQNFAAEVEFRRPCEDPKGQGESDLCAQWRAANAAEDSAFWAMLAFWPTCFGVVGLIVTIMQSRLAIYRVEEANRIALTSQRPWLSLELGHEAMVHPGQHDGGPQHRSFTFNISVKNYGERPAINANIAVVIGTSRQGFDPKVIEQILRRKGNPDISSEAPVFPGEERRLSGGQHFSGPFVRFDTGEEIAAPLVERTVIAIAVLYRDIHSNEAYMTGSVSYCILPAHSFEGDYLNAASRVLLERNRYYSFTT